MVLDKNALEDLKLIHQNKTDTMLYDQEALEMGTRILNLFRIIAKKIPEGNQESDE